MQLQKSAAMRAQALRAPKHNRSSVLPPARSSPSAATTTTTVEAEVVAMEVKQWGAATLKGTVRKINEDRYDVKVASPSKSSVGDPFVFAGVYDGHGGIAVADWLSKNLFSVVEREWPNSFKPEVRITEAYLAADRKLLSSSSGFMGMGERGIGGSKCGATAANVILYKEKDGSTKLLTSNIGDARIVLCSASGPKQLSEDHVPDREEERMRIERTNPNPKLPLVRYQGGTWRVGGLLALSRAFGDAYLKGSLQFEGLAAGSDGYSSGFGVIAEPYTTVTTLTDEDQWLVIASDGLFAEEERGGGGGLDNTLLHDLLTSATATDCNTIAETLAQTAVSMGSTDDVSVVVLRLGRA